VQATSRRAQTGLQQAASSPSGWRIGRTYGALIVVQVAVSVAILPYAFSSAWTSVREALADPGYPAAQFLTARLELEPGSFPATASARLRDRKTELARRLASEPGVSDVTFLAGLPGSEPRRWIELDGRGDVREVGVGLMGTDFGNVLEVPLLSGRSFQEGDVGTPARHVIVNRSFARHVLGADALGRRVRQLEDAGRGPWLEIVGIIEDIPAAPAGAAPTHARLYHPASAGDEALGLLAVRVRGGEPAAFAPRLREMAAAVDPGLLLDDVRPMASLVHQQRLAARLAAALSGCFTLSLLLLSATGLYALMSFTVTQRRREIGIRVALGATTGRLLRSIFARALWQLTAGIVLGGAVAAMVAFETGGESAGGAGWAMVPLVAGVVLLIGVLAVAGPARRGLRIEASEALKEG
jgi:putative ABC transport system permease protein